MGGEKAAMDRTQLLEKGITLVINAAAASGVTADGFECLALYLQDRPDEDMGSLFPLVIQSIENAWARGGKVFVHCHQGVSRSATLVVAYLMWKQGRCFYDALQYVKARRSVVSPNPGFLVQLMWWGRHLAAPPKRAVWAYLPHTSMGYPYRHSSSLPLYTFQPLETPKERGAKTVPMELDENTCYGVVAQPQDGGGAMSVSFYGGKLLSAGAREDAANLLHITCTHAFYTQPNEAQSIDQHGSVITFKPVVLSGEVRDISNDPTKAVLEVFESALGVQVAMAGGLAPDAR